MWLTKYFHSADMQYGRHQKQEGLNEVSSSGPAARNSVGCSHRPGRQMSVHHLHDGRRHHDLRVLLKDRLDNLDGLIDHLGRLSGDQLIERRLPGVALQVPYRHPQRLSEGRQCV